MGEDYDRKWLWRGRHLRNATTLGGKILADLQTLSQSDEVRKTEYWDPESRSNSWVRMNGMRVDKLFDLGELAFKEMLLRVHFLLCAVTAGVAYVVNKYALEFDHIGYLAVSGLAACCAYLLYEGRFVVLTACVGVTGICVATAALNLGPIFIVIAIPMVLTLVFYLIARMRAGRPL